MLDMLGALRGFTSRDKYPYDNSGYGMTPVTLKKNILKVYKQIFFGPFPLCTSADYFCAQKIFVTEVAPARVQNQPT